MSPGSEAANDSRLLRFSAPCQQAVHAESPPVLEVGKFSAAQEGTAPPDDWKLLTFPKIGAPYHLSRRQGRWDYHDKGDERRLPPRG